MNPKGAERLSLKTGLRISTCKDLLQRGWTYQEEDGKPPVWLSPAASLRESATNTAD